MVQAREHQVDFPDVKELERPADYSLASYREELVRQICGFQEYQDPRKPSCTRPPTATPSPPPGVFETVHIRVVHAKFAGDIASITRSITMLKVSL